MSARDTPGGRHNRNETVRDTHETAPTTKALCQTPPPLTPGVVKQDKSSGGSVDTTKTRLLGPSFAGHVNRALSGCGP